MYYVFLDTNVFDHDFKLSKQHNKLLLKYAKRNSIQICITYTNYREIIKRYKDSISPLIKYARAANTNYYEVSNEYLFEIKKTEFYVCEYKKYLDELIAEYRIEIITHSSDIATRVIDKFFDNKKPFDYNKPSFRDAIIWETIRDFYNEKYNDRQDKIFFISNNSKDFGERINKEGIKIQVLHSDLSRDAPNLVLYGNSFDFFSNVTDELENILTKNFVIDKDEIIRRIKIYLENSDDVQSKIDSHFLNDEFEGAYFEGWGEDAYSDLSDIAIDDYSMDIESKEIELVVTLQYHVNFSIVTVNGGYERDDPDDDEFLRDEEGSTDIQLTCYVIFSNEDDELEITDFSIEELRYII